MPHDNSPALGIDRVRSALVAAAYVVKAHGPRYAPIMDRLAREYERLQREGTAESRADRILISMTAEVEVQALIA